MSYSVRVGTSAEKDLLQAVLWYEEIRSGLGIRFEDDLRNAVSQLTENPYSCQIRYDDTRIIFLKIFPYGIHYRIQEDQVQVPAVLHTSRKPHFKG